MILSEVEISALELTPAQKITLEGFAFHRKQDARTAARMDAWKKARETLVTISRDVSELNDVRLDALVLRIPSDINHPTQEVLVDELRAILVEIATDLTDPETAIRAVRILKESF